MRVNCFRAFGIYLNPPRHTSQSTQPQQFPAITDYVWRKRMTSIQHFAYGYDIHGRDFSIRFHPDQNAPAAEKQELATVLFR